MGHELVQRNLDDDNGMDTLDFTLPGDVTDDIIAVNFDDSGDVDSIAMES